MRACSTGSAVEAREDRCVPSTVAAYGDFNHDGRLDKTAITAPRTITVSLATPDGNYTVSARLKIPKDLPFGGITVGDSSADGKLDVSGISGGGSGT